MIKHQSIKVTGLQSLCWHQEDLYDWLGGFAYLADGSKQALALPVSEIAYDAAIQSKDGQYVILYQHFGVHGIILKNLQIIRTISRADYQANITGYPIHFIHLENGKIGIIHCPNEYNKIEIEDIETGEKWTTDTNRDPDDCFHSALRVNDAQTYLLSNGWIWHPYMVADLFNIKKGLADNHIFDKSYMFQKTRPYFSVDAEVGIAEFLTDDLILLATLDEGDIELGSDSSGNQVVYPNEAAVYSISERKLTKKISNANFQKSILIPLDEHTLLALWDTLKVIDLNTGEVLETYANINCFPKGEYKRPLITLDLKNRRVALGLEKNIELFYF